MSRDLAARLRALAERHPVAADAAELEAIADSLTASRGKGGRAKAVAHEAACRRSRETALEIAASKRASDPDVSQSALARVIKASLGASVPDVQGLRRLVRGWERQGKLPLPVGRLLTAGHPKR